MATTKKPPPSISFSGWGGAFGKHQKRESDTILYHSNLIHIIMSTYKEVREAFIKNAKNNVIAKPIIKNPVAATCAGVYITGSTLAYTAAGVSFKAALAYSIGVTMVYGAMGYGVYKLASKMMEEDTKKA